MVPPIAPPCIDVHRRRVATQTEQGLRATPREERSELGPPTGRAAVGTKLDSRTNCLFVAGGTSGRGRSGRPDGGTVQAALASGNSGQQRFSNLAIETALTVRLVFRLPLRQTEAFVRSHLPVMRAGLVAPEFERVAEAAARSRRAFVPCRESHDRAWQA